MRLVLDTNTALSGLIWRGTPGRLIEAAQEKQITLISSVPLLSELRGVLEREKFAKPLAARRLAVRDLFDGYAALAEIVTPARITPIIVRDPSDDRVLAAALTGGADFIVSGDAHLLDLKRYHGIDIVTAATAAQRIGQEATNERASPNE